MHASNRSLLLSSILVLLGACAAPNELAGVAPSGDDDTLEDTQVITSVNTDGSWTAAGQQPYVTCGYAESSAVFTGPSGKTRKMGVCLLKRTNTTCTTVANCDSAPLTLPAGGFRYCTAPNGTGTKYCYYRPGYADEYCAGSPANGGVPVPPGTYTAVPTIATNAINGTWLSYACFEGCFATDPSSSSTSFSLNKLCP